MDFSISILPGQDRCEGQCSSSGVCKKELICDCELYTYGKTCAVKIFPLVEKEEPIISVKIGQFHHLEVSSKYLTNLYSLQLSTISDQESLPQTSLRLLFVLGESSRIPGLLDYDWKMDLASDLQSGKFPEIKLTKMITEEYTKDYSMLNLPILRIGNIYTVLHLADFDSSNPLTEHDQLDHSLIFD